MATISPHTTRATGTILTAVIYNGDHANHILNATNLNNAKIEGPGPVADNAFVLFDGTSGFAVKSGGVTAGTSQIADNAITNAKLADMTDGTVKGRAVGAGTGDPTDLSQSQVRTLVGSLFGVGGVSFLSTTPSTLTSSQSGQIIMNVGSNRSVTVPAPSSFSGLNFAFYTLSGDLTINASAGEAFIFPDGSTPTSFTMTSQQRCIMVGDSTNWIVFPFGFRPAPGVHLLATGTVSSAATLDLVLTAYTGYRALKFVLQLIPATDGVALYSRFSTNGGSSYDAGASDYNYAGLWVGDATGGGVTSGGIQSGAAAQIQISSPQAGYLIGNGSAEGTHTEVTLMGQANAALWSRLIYQGYHISNNATPLGCHQTGGGARETAQDTDAIRFLFSSGNIASGNYAVYGLA